MSADMVEQDEITIGELGRSLRTFRDDYLRDQDERKRDMIELRTAICNLQMVSPAVYQANREADLRRIEGLEMEALTAIQTRQQFLRSFALGLVGWLITIAVFATTIVTN